MPYLFFRISCLCILSALLFQPSMALGSDRAAEKTRLQQGIQKFHINIQSLRQGIQQQKQQIADNKTQERNLLAELETIDLRLHKQLDKLAALQHKRDDQQTLILEKEQELLVVAARKLEVQSHLQARITAYYKMGNIGFMNVIFSAETLPEILLLHDSFNTLIEYDKKLLLQYKEAIASIQESKRMLVLEKALLEDLIKQEETRKIEISATKKAKTDLLTMIRTQNQLKQYAIREMEQAEADLTSSLIVMQKQEEMFDHGFELARGKLPLPIRGEIIARFGKTHTNKLGIARKSSGIAIKCDNNKVVSAIFDGVILFSGYLRGYGNTIVINHGYKHYTVTARVERLLKKKGARVTAGTPIAVTGETATLVDDGVYFEVRHRNVPMDPLLWLLVGSKANDYPTP